MTNNMNRTLLLIFLLLGGLSLQSLAPKSALVQHFGEKIDEKGAIPVSQLKGKMGTKEKLDCKISGPVAGVCQVKGCWMTFKLSATESVRVTFKDYAFFVPKNIAGKTAIAEGTAFVETTSVEELRHYAEDAGKSKEEIKAIVAPEQELVFEARGVIIR